MRECIFKEKALRLVLTMVLTLSVVSAFGYGSAKVNKVWLEHGVTKNGEKGITIHADINTSGLKGHKIRGTAFFYDANKNVLKGGIAGYKTTTGQVCASAQSTATYENSHWENFEIFMPYRALPLASGKHTYYVIVGVDDLEQNKTLVTNWDYVSFTGTGSGAGGQNHQANKPNNQANAGSNKPTKTWREELGYGGFTIVTQYANGYIQRVRWRACPNCRATKACASCHGGGYCGLCNGRGGIISAGYGTFIPCAMCSQTGRCQLCKGSGRCACTAYEYPGYVVGSTSMIAPDGNTVRDNYNYNTGGGDSNPSGGGSNNASCSACGGTGVSKTPNSGGSQPSWVAYYNKRGTHCQYCGKYTDHFHDRCARCNVPKR